MRLEELEWFLLLAKTGHVTRTAELLHVSQPGLSRAVSRLEEEVGAPLFDRRAKRLRVNQAGEILFAHAARAVSELDTARARIQALSGGGGDVVGLAYVTSFGSWLVPRLLQRSRSLNRTTAFVLQGGPADDVLESVRTGAVDCGITSPRPADSALQWHPLVDEKLGLAVPVAHRLAVRSSVSAAELQNDAFVALRPPFGLRQISDAYFQGHGFQPRVIVETTELSSVAGIVAAGVGVAVLPVDHPHPGVVVVPFADGRALRTAGIVTLAYVRLRAEVLAFVEMSVDEFDIPSGDPPS